MAYEGERHPGPREQLRGQDEAAAAAERSARDRGVIFLGTQSNPYQVRRRACQKSTGEMGSKPGSFCRAIWRLSRSIFLPAT